jgi:response regulator RpfG family c-di-GMP phosphodiesterase
MNNLAAIEEQSSAGTAETPQPRILFVDDEQNILSSLRRLFRTHGYEVLTAGSGAAGLEILAQEPVDLIISDMRMPEMDGAQFLEQVRQRWPDTIRMLLTGYSDIPSILAAINRGEIYRYITKPWDDNDIVLVVLHALERRALEQEKKRLEALILAQNDELRDLNASLEVKVAERTAELKTANASLLTANEKLKISFLTSIKAFSSLIEMRNGRLAGHSRRTADLARKIAMRMGLSDAETQEVFFAGLLHNIGKIGLPDELLSTPLKLMDDAHLSLYRKHPLQGEQALTPLEDLRGAARIVRSQLERYDGSGAPDRLSGLQIPIGARILAVASDYDDLQCGAIQPRKFSAAEAQAAITNTRTEYDPRVIEAFLYIVSGPVGKGVPDTLIAASDLRPGMTLSRDLITPAGMLLLSTGHVLNQKLIRQINDFMLSGEGELIIYVLADRKI